jgi:hypothetical protein
MSAIRMMTGIGTPISQSSMPLPKPITMSSVLPASAPAQEQTLIGPKCSVRPLHSSFAGTKAKARGAVEDGQADRESFGFQSRAISSASGLATTGAPPMTSSERSSFRTLCHWQHIDAVAGAPDRSTAASLVLFNSAAAPPKVLRWARKVRSGPRIGYRIARRLTLDLLALDPTGIEEGFGG